MAQKQFTNVYAFVGVVLFFALVVTGIALAGGEAVSNSNAELDNDSLSYIAQLQGLDTGAYSSTSATEIEQSILVNPNFSQGNPKDEGLDTLFAREKGTPIELYIKSVFLMPSVILYDILRLDASSWSWIVSILNGAWLILITIALVYFARGVPT